MESYEAGSWKLDEAGNYVPILTDDEYLTIYYGSLSFAKATEPKAN